MPIGIFDDAKVLIVDDEKKYLADFVSLFSKKFNLITADGGEEGLSLLDKGSVAVVVSDQRMPKMTGSQFLAEVSKRSPQTVRILLTGYSDIEAVIEAVNKGEIYRYVSKDTPLREIELVVQQGLDKFHLEESNRRLLMAKKKLLKSLAVQENLSLFGTFGQEIHQQMEALVMNLFNYVFEMKKESNEKTVLADFHKLQGALSRLRELASFSRKLRVSSMGLQKGGLNLLLQEAADKAKAVSQKSGSCEIHLDLEEGLPPISIHRYSIMRVLKELIENAILFAPEGKKEIWIRSRFVEGQINGDIEEKASIRIEVEDNGSGIKVEEVSKSFVPFYTTLSQATPPEETLPPQPDDYNLSQYYHFGFGLPIAQWLVCLRHQGSIELLSQSGKGTSAVVTIPVS